MDILSTRNVSRRHIRVSWPPKVRYASWPGIHPGVSGAIHQA
jgi:hypothetical protein